MNINILYQKECYLILSDIQIYFNVQELVIPEEYKLKSNSFFIVIHLIHQLFFQINYKCVIINNIKIKVP